MLDVEITYGPQQATLLLMVVQGKGPSLFEGLDGSDQTKLVKY